MVLADGIYMYYLYKIFYLEEFASRIHKKYGILLYSQFFLDEISVSLYVKRRFQLKSKIGKSCCKNINTRELLNHKCVVSFILNQILCLTNSIGLVQCHICSVWDFFVFICSSQAVAFLSSLLRWISVSRAGLRKLPPQHKTAGYVMNFINSKELLMKDDFLWYTGFRKSNISWKKA